MMKNSNVNVKKKNVLNKNVKLPKRKSIERKKNNLTQLRPKNAKEKRKLRSVKVYYILWKLKKKPTNLCNSDGIHLK